MHIEIDNFDRNGWNHLITQFDDASLFQTWSYGVVGKGTVSNIVLKEGNGVLGCCQVTLRRLPFFKIGIANIKWGPLCMKKGENFRPDVLLCLIRSIKEEYAIKRGYLLRIEPCATGERKELLKQILDREGFKINPTKQPYRTLKLDLSLPVDEIRKSFLQKWRNCLNKAERSELSLIQGTNEVLYEIATNIAKDMVKRKKLILILDFYEQLRMVQKDLPDPLKMQIMLCSVNGEFVNAIICSAIGNTGIYVLGATGQKGLGLSGAYLLQWKMIQWMKENGVRYYDLGGFNPQSNSMVSHFKKGIAGKNGWEETFLGEFYGCFNFSSWMTMHLRGTTKLLRSLYEPL